MRISVGIDIAKEVPWVTALDAHGVVRLAFSRPRSAALIPAPRGCCTR